MPVADRPVPSADDAAQRAEYFNGLVWHAGTYAVVNGGCWLIDLLGRGTIDWAYLVTVPWTLALAFHAAAYWVGGSGLRHTKVLRFLR